MVEHIEKKSGFLVLTESTLSYACPQTLPPHIGDRQCYRRHRSKKRDECATREPKRAWITGGRQGCKSGGREHLRFLPDFFLMTANDHDFAMIEDVEARIWRIQETIRVKELAATHRLGKIRRLLMHEEHKTWKREFGFDRIEMAAEMDENRSRTSTSPVPNPFFYRNMVIPRYLHNPVKFTLEMKVDVEG